MTHRSAPIAALALAASACASQQAAKYDPFKVPRDEFFGSIKTVALAPMRTPADLENAGAVKAKFEAAVTAKLEGAGLKVIAPAEVGPVVEAASVAQGGLFDPATGELVEAKAKAAKLAAIAQLKEKCGADALLRVDLRVVWARLSHDVAAWHGVTESASTGFWKAFFVGSHSGQIRALSIMAWLTGADGTDLYANAGGLRIVGRVNAAGKQELIPQADLFADESLNARALSLALDPLLGIAPAAAEAGDE